MILIRAIHIVKIEITVMIVMKVRRKKNRKMWIWYKMIHLLRQYPIQPKKQHHLQNHLLMTLPPQIWHLTLHLLPILILLQLQPLLLLILRMTPKQKRYSRNIWKVKSNLYQHSNLKNDVKYYENWNNLFNYSNNNNKSNTVSVSY